jgi:hypothetical protein
MSEARKYHLNLIVANQFTTQLTQEIRDAVFGNMGTIVSFRVGQNDVESLGKYFAPTFDGEDLLRVPNHNTIVRTLIGGIPTNPFSMVTLPPLGTPNPRLGAALKQLSAAKYGRPRAVVDKEISERMSTQAPARPAQPAYAQPQVGQGQPGRARPAQAGPAAAQPTGTGSFLDEWLAKREQGVPSPSVAPATPPAAQQAPAQPPAIQTEHQPLAEPPQSAAAEMQAYAPNEEDLERPSGAPLPSSPVFAAEPPRTEAAPAARTTGNISSAELERTEVQKTAAELKKELEEKADNAATEAARQDGHVADVENGNNDTIFIDHDGAFTQAGKSEQQS